MLKNNHGFSLLELLVTIAILGTLSGLVVIRFVGAQRSARDARRLSDLRQYQSALEVYANSHNDKYPSGSGSLTGLCSTLSVPCIDDPRAPDQHYRYAIDGAGTEYTLWAKLEHPAEDTWYVFCSNGAASEVTSEPSSSSCPI